MENSMRTLLRAFVLLLVPAAVALAQNAPPTTAVALQGKPPAATAAPTDNTLSEHTRVAYRYVKSVLLRSAEIMPEESYTYRPTEKVRTFGQIVGHVADAQYIFCSAVLGEKNPLPKVEQTRSSKADLIAALKAAGTYCDKAYDGMTDASATGMVTLRMGDMPKLFALTANNLHSIEHYGNLITYLRMKDLVPPSSDPEFMRQAMK
jgi:uncharacterized damage-inducible protein DinB